MDELLAVIAGALIACLFVSLIWYIILVIANWKIFTKAGEAGWKSIIPFYNTYIIYKISWETKMFWIMMGASVVGMVLNYLAGENGGFLSVIGAVFSLAGTVIAIMGVHKLSKAFGHGVGFTLGLLFLSPIFSMILGFGASKYIGKDGGNSVA